MKFIDRENELSRLVALSKRRDGDWRWSEPTAEIEETEG